jgi:hypothetical protein
MEAELGEAGGYSYHRGCLRNTGSPCPINRAEGEQSGAIDGDPADFSGRTP